MDAPPNAGPVRRVDPPPPDDRPVPWRLAAALAALLPLGWALQRLAAAAPDLTERIFSQSLFPVLRDTVAFIAGWLPFSLAELGLAGLALWALVRLVRGVIAWRTRRRSLRNLAGHAGSRAAAFAGTGYAVFLLLWGFNYSREPFAHHAGLEVRSAPALELAALVEDLVARANDLRARVKEDEEGVHRPTNGFEGILDRLDGVLARTAAVYAVLGGRPPVVRPALSGAVLTACGITGIYSPFTGEAHVNTGIPAPHMAFTLCHEVAHARGFAREDEANFIAYVTCSLSEDVDFAYSGVLAALRYAQGSLRMVDRSRARALSQRLSPAVQRDQAAVRAFWQRHRTRLRLVVHSVNDLYLKSQGQKTGARSYGRMVDLLLAQRRADTAAR